MRSSHARGRDATRAVRLVGLLAVAAAVAVVVPRLIGAPGEEDAQSVPDAGVEGQRVVVWTVSGEGEGAFVAVLATGRKPPVAVAVPGDITINLPGQNLGTLADAAAAGDVGFVEVTIENLLGVRVDATVDTPLDELPGLVDRLGTVDVAGRTLAGASALEYLTSPGEDAPPDARFLRWQDVLDGVLGAAKARPGGVSALPEPLRPVILSVASSGARPVALPVVDIGGGLLRPDVKGVEELVEQRFVPVATGDELRVVVLNGVGTPGIGEQVARILVPEGFRVVASGNAKSFNVKETMIIASSRDDLQTAERARTLLGAGRVYLGNQPTGLANLTVVVGRDFGGS